MLRASFCCRLNQSVHCVASSSVTHVTSVGVYKVFTLGFCRRRLQSFYSGVLPSVFTRFLLWSFAVGVYKGFTLGVCRRCLQGFQSGVLPLPVSDTVMMPEKAYSKQLNHVQASSEYLQTGFSRLGRSAWRGSMEEMSAGWRGSMGERSTGRGIMAERSAGRGIMAERSAGRGMIAEKSEGRGRLGEDFIHGLLVLSLRVSLVGGCNESKTKRKQGMSEQVMVRLTT